MKWLCFLIFGLVILVRPAAAPLIVVPYLYDFFRRREWRSSLKGFLYMHPRQRVRYSWSGFARH
ncbi:MAG: hypothetical protein AB2448_10910 [Moorella sp. (in: firmicutes)]